MLTNHFMVMKEDSEDYYVSAIFTLHDDLTYEITGPEPDLVDMSHRVIAPDHPKKFLLFEDDPVEWARNFTNSCRTPYLYIDTVEDTFPPSPYGAPAEAK